MAEYIEREALVKQKKEWLVFYLFDWQELLCISIDGIMDGEIAETVKLLAYENRVKPKDIVVKKEIRRGYFYEM